MTYSITSKSPKTSCQGSYHQFTDRTPASYNQREFYYEHFGQDDSDSYEEYDNYYQYEEETDNYCAFSNDYSSRQEFYDGDLYGEFDHDRPPCNQGGADYKKPHKNNHHHNPHTYESKTVIPFLNLAYKHHHIKVKLSSEATLNVIDSAFAQQCDIPIYALSSATTNLAYLLPTSTLVGEVHCIFRHNGYPLRFSAVAVDEHDTLITAGMPFMEESAIALDLGRSEIIIGGSKVICYGQNSHQHRSNTADHRVHTIGPKYHTTVQAKVCTSAVGKSKRNNSPADAVNKSGYTCILQQSACHSYLDDQEEFETDSEDEYYGIPHDLNHCTHKNHKATSSWNDLHDIHKVNDNDVHVWEYDKNESINRHAKHGEKIDYYSDEIEDNNCSSVSNIVRGTISAIKAEDTDHTDKGSELELHQNSRLPSELNGTEQALTRYPMQKNDNRVHEGDQEHNSTHHSRVDSVLIDRNQFFTGTHDKEDSSHTSGDFRCDTLGSINNPPGKVTTHLSNENTKCPALDVHDVKLQFSNGKPANNAQLSHHANASDYDLAEQGANVSSTFLNTSTKSGERVRLLQLEGKNMWQISNPVIISIPVPILRSHLCRPPEKNTFLFNVCSRLNSYNTDQTQRQEKTKYSSQYMRMFIFTIKTSLCLHHIWEFRIVYLTRIGMLTDQSNCCPTLD